MRLLLKILVYAAALWVAVKLVPGLSFEGDLVALVLIALVFAAVNAVVKPIVKVLSLPLVVLTLGLFLLVVNAIMLAITIWLAGEFGLGIESSGFGATFLGAVLVSLVAWAGEALLDRD